ncbi:MAG: hypothetical protein AAGH15_03105 [Myxococcota bacterium]
MDAVAVLPIPLSSLEARLPRVGEADGFAVLAREARRLRARALDDGTLLHVGVPFAADPRVLGGRLVADLGPLADECHGRRVYVFPDVVEPTKTTVLGIAQELGEGGEWIALPEAQATPDPVAQAFAGGMPDLGALDPSVLERAQAMMGGLPGAPAGLDVGALQGAMQAVLQNPDAMAMMQQMAGQLFGGGAPGEGTDPAAFDPASLLEKAQGLAAKMSEESPDLVDAIRRGMEGAGEGKDPDEG